MNFLQAYPAERALLNVFDQEKAGFPLKVNNHIHTPYSFSAFSSVEEAIDMAVNEDVRILGINDFYVRDGYDVFIEQCRKKNIFPLLNIELIGISREDQEAGIRVNDPGNPGRTYISGKGLAHPSVLPEAQEQKLKQITLESNRQVSQMIELLNQWLAKQETGLSLSVEEIMEKDAKQLLRERHVAKAMRLKLQESARSEEEFDKLIRKVYGGQASGKKWDDIPGLEEELRARLLKAGAPAFVPEDERAFLPLEEIIRMIRDAGGIPTYPMLLDGTGGEPTSFESGKEKLAEVLKERGFTSVEMIPLRNKIETLKAYVEYFYEQGFMVSFGTEHNTTAMRPLTVDCKNGVQLDASLQEISFKGVACVAAHQYLTAKDKDTGAYSRTQLETLGQAVIYHFFKS